MLKILDDFHIQLKQLRYQDWESPIKLSHLIEHLTNVIESSYETNPDYPFLKASIISDFKRTAKEIDNWEFHEDAGKREKREKEAFTKAQRESLIVFNKLLIHIDSLSLKQIDKNQNT